EKARRQLPPAIRLDPSSFKVGSVTHDRYSKQSLTFLLELKNGRLPWLSIDRFDDSDLITGRCTEFLEAPSGGQDPIFQRANSAVVRTAGFFEAVPDVGNMLGQRSHSLVKLLAQFAYGLGVLGNLFLLPTISDGMEQC